MKIFTLITSILLLFDNFLFAQSTPCPLNLDFEENNYGQWIFSTGTCCPITTPIIGQLINRHDLVNGINVDPYGGFPIVSPTGANYSLRLGNEDIGSEAEKASYILHVPNSIINYNLIFHYAVVFQDPGHFPSEQPRFIVNAYDSATGVSLPCASFTFIADDALPGFLNSPLSSDVKYKPWTTASVNLSGYQGQTIVVEFATGDCSLGAHFGYGYLDLNCALFEIDIKNCVETPVYIAPPGFELYTWYNSDYSTILGYGENFNYENLAPGAVLNLVLSPFPGFGCGETLSTTKPLISVVQTDLSITVCAPETYHGHTETGIYVDSFKSMNGCDSLINLNLTVLQTACNCRCVIPNAFSPNFDSKNDYFKPIFNCELIPREYKMLVFNRWGQQLFVTTNYVSGWNGRNGESAYDLGTYFYYVEYINPYSNERVIKHGDFTLVK